MRSAAEHACRGAVTRGTYPELVEGLVTVRSSPVSPTRNTGVGACLRRCVFSWAYRARTAEAVYKMRSAAEHACRRAVTRGTYPELVEGLVTVRSSPVSPTDLYSHPPADGVWHIVILNILVANDFIMNKTLSVQQMYFLSGLLFTVGFALSLVAGFVYPLPAHDPETITDTVAIIDTTLWIIPIVGSALFLLGFATSRSK